MKKEYDLKTLKKRPGRVKTDPGAAKVPVSIRLDGAVLAQLRTEAQRLGIAYQTFVGSILHRYVCGALIDPKSANLSDLLKRAS
jgi:predicted DNA binding CopG/RHH family protein